MIRTVGVTLRRGVGGGAIFVLGLGAWSSAPHQLVSAAAAGPALPLTSPVWSAITTLRGRWPPRPSLRFTCWRLPRRRRSSRRERQLPPPQGAGSKRRFGRGLPGRLGRSRAARTASRTATAPGGSPTNATYRGAATPPSGGGTRAHSASPRDPCPEPVPSW